MSSRLLKALGVVSSLTFVSRILGFVRDMVIAHSFGAGTGADAFLVAFKIPNFMRRLFAEGAFAQAFVPVLSAYKTQREHTEVQNLVNHVAGTLGSVLFVITLLGMLAAPVLVLLFAPGFFADSSKFALTGEMLRITFPYIFFISLTAFAGAILNAYGRFAAPALTPVLLNLCLIAAALWWAPHFNPPILALAWGVLIAGLVQFLFQLPFLLKLQLLPKPIVPFVHRNQPPHEGVQRILKLMLPAVFAVSVTQISLLIDTLMASFLATGSVAWLYYSDRLLEFPIGVFGVALATVVLPKLSRQAAADQQQNYSDTLNWSLRWVFIIGLPCTLGLMLLAVPIMATLFQRGEFNATDVSMSARSLIAYSLGLIAFVLIKILASGFFAQHNTKTPMRIAIIAMLSNIGMNLLFIVPLAHAGLALATALSASLNATLLYVHLRRENHFQLQPGWGRFFLRLGLASTAMSLVLWWGVPAAHWWENAGEMACAGQLSLWISAAAAVYLAVLWLSGLRPKMLL